jgi:hypothetical protein
MEEVPVSTETDQLDLYANLGMDSDPNLSADTDTETPDVEQTLPGSEQTEPTLASQESQSTQPGPLEQQYQQLTHTYIPALTRERDRAVADYRQLSETVSGLREYHTAIQSHGLSTQEATVGLQMAAAYKANPGAFLTNLIRVAQSQGVSLPEGVPQQGLDAGTLAQVIDQRLRPLLEPIEQQRREAEAHRQVQAQVQSFYTELPDARVHEDTIAAYINAHTERGLPITLHKAYVDLYRYAQTNGLDWSQPLTGQTQAQRQATAQPPNLGGRRTVSPGVSTEVKMADPNKSWKQIVNETVAELGLQ